MFKMTVKNIFFIVYTINFHRANVSNQHIIMNTPDF